MRIVLLYFLLSASLVGFAQKSRLDVTSIAPGYWVHTSYSDYKGRPFPSNGLIVEMADAVLIVDSGWGEKPTRALLRWVRRHLKKPVKMLLVTHSHEDRIGGLVVLKKKNIPLGMSKQTAALLAKEGIQVPDYEEIADPSKEPDHVLPYECYYPGAGHTSDNVVVYFKSAGLLFGGCFVKSLEAEGLGNVADADLKAWPAAIQRVQSRFPEVRIVVPGHQAWGGPGLLQYTLELLKIAPK